MTSKRDDGTALTSLINFALGKQLSIVDVQRLIGQKVIIHAENFSAVSTILTLSGDNTSKDKQRLLIGIAPVLGRVSYKDRQLNFLQVAEQERFLQHEISPNMTYIQTYRMEWLEYEYPTREWTAIGICDPLPQLLKNVFWEHQAELGRRVPEKYAYLAPGAILEDVSVEVIS